MHEIPKSLHSNSLVRDGMLHWWELFDYSLSQAKLKQMTLLFFFFFLLLSLEENKALCFMWNLCIAEDSHEITSLIFSETQWKNIQNCRLLQSWLAP